MLCVCPGVFLDNSARPNIRWTDCQRESRMLRELHWHVVMNGHCVHKGCEIYQKQKRDVRKSCNTVRFSPFSQYWAGMGQSDKKNASEPVLIGLLLPLFVVWVQPRWISLLRSMKIHSQLFYCRSFIMYPGFFIYFLNLVCSKMTQTLPKRGDGTSWNPQNS